MAPPARTATLSTVVVPSSPAPKVLVHKTARVRPSSRQNAAEVGDVHLLHLRGDQHRERPPDLGRGLRSRLSVRSTCPAPAGSGLAPGASETCTADHTHTVTQADVDTGKDRRLGHRDRHRPPGPPVAHLGPVYRHRVLTVSAKPDVSVRKAATVSPAADQTRAKEGDSIAFSFVVTNTGNVTLTSVAVSDPSGGPVGLPRPSRARPGAGRLGDLYRQG